MYDGPYINVIDGNISVLIHKVQELIETECYAHIQLCTVAVLSWYMNILYIVESSRAFQHNASNNVSCNASNIKCSDIHLRSDLHGEEAHQVIGGLKKKYRVWKSHCREVLCR